MIKSGFSYSSGSMVSNTDKEIMAALTSRFGNPEWVGIECRLAPGRNQADFMCHLTKEEGHKVLLEDGVRPAAWMIKRRPLIRWVQENKALSRWLEGYWLEYDLEGVDSVDTLTDPLFFLVFHPWEYGYDLLVELLREVLPRAGKQGEAVRQKLYGCIRIMEPGIQLYAIGFLESRSPDKLRLVLRVSDRELLWRYLERTGWPDWKSLRDQWGDLTNVADHFLVHFDIDVDGLHQRLGLELVVQPPGEQKKIKSTLDMLERQDLCATDKKQVVLDWPGSYREDGELWVRYVNYLKVNFFGSGRQEAKAYLFYRKVDPEKNYPST